MKNCRDYAKHAAAWARTEEGWPFRRARQSAGDLAITSQSDCRRFSRGCDDVLEEPLGRVEAMDSTPGDTGDSPLSSPRATENFVLTAHQNTTATLASLFVKPH